MIDITVYNSFHGSTTTLTADDTWNGQTTDGEPIIGRITSEAFGAAALRLCGMQECVCDGLHLNMDSTIFDVEGRLFFVE